MKVEGKWKSLGHVQLFAIPPTVDCQASLSFHSLGQDTGVGSHSLLQGIFLTRESNQDLLHCRRILYWLNYQGNPINWRFVPVLSWSSLLVLCFATIFAHLLPLCHILVSLLYFKLSTKRRLRWWLAFIRIMHFKIVFI